MSLSDRCLRSIGHVPFLLPMRLALLLVLGIALGSCDSATERPPRVLPPSETISVTYRIEPTAQYGAPSVDAIRYTGADGETGTLGSVSLPWTVLVLAPRDEDRIYTLEGELNAGGEVTGMVATIAIDGEVVSQGAVQGQAGALNQTRRATASYRYRP